LFRVDSNGRATRLLPLEQGSADLATRPDGILMIPMMSKGIVFAYRVD